MEAGLTHVTTAILPQRKIPRFSALEELLSDNSFIALDIEGSHEQEKISRIGVVYTHNLVSERQASLSEFYAT